MVTNRHIGSPVERVEDLRFLRGRGEYIDDVVKDGQLYAVVLRSQIAHGRIRSIDTKPALRMAGVHSIITAGDLGSPVPTVTIRLQPMPSLVPFQQPVMAHGKVRYVGEPLALVLAQSVALAEDAAAAIEIEIDALPAIIDRHASARDETLLFEKHGSNQPVKYTAVLGDAGAAFRKAAYIRREQFRVNRHAAVPMETRGLLAEWDESQGRLVLHGAAKVAFFNRRMLAEKLGLAEDKVDLVENDVGGGFGARAANFILRISSFLSQRGAPAVRSNGPRTAARI